MYFEFESMSSSMSSSANELSMTSPPMSATSGLSRRHRRLSSSSQSLRELIDTENVIENITPSHCDLYLITRKKLSQINGNTLRQTQDLRREVLLTSIHRNITSKSSITPTNSTTITANDLMVCSSPEPSVATNRSDKSQTLMATDCDQQFKYVTLSSTIPTMTACTTTTANTSSATRMMTSTAIKTIPSVIKKRNLTQTPQQNSDYEEEWKTTIKRLKVVHGLDANPLDVSMDSEFDSGYCDSDLNDLTNNFHCLKTPFT